MSNFDDFDPLRLEPNVALEFLQPGKPIPGDADSGHTAGLEGDDR